MTLKRLSDSPESIVQSEFSTAPEVTIVSNTQSTDHKQPKKNQYLPRKNLLPLCAPSIKNPPKQAQLPTHLLSTRNTRADENPPSSNTKLVSNSLAGSVEPFVDEDIDKNSPSGYGNNGEDKFMKSVREYIARTRVKDHVLLLQISPSLGEEQDGKSRLPSDRYSYGNNPQCDANICKPNVPPKKQPARGECILDVNDFDKNPARTNTTTTAAPVTEETNTTTAQPMTEKPDDDGEQENPPPFPGELTTTKSPDFEKPQHQSDKPKFAAVHMNRTTALRAKYNKYCGGSINSRTLAGTLVTKKNLALKEAIDAKVTKDAMKIPYKNRPKPYCISGASMGGNREGANDPLKAKRKLQRMVRRICRASDPVFPYYGGYESDDSKCKTRAAGSASRARTKMAKKKSRGKRERKMMTEEGSSNDMETKAVLSAIIAYLGNSPRLRKKLLG